MSEHEPACTRGGADSSTGLEPGHTHRIELENVGVKLGKVQVLYGVNAVMRCGEITAVIGPNGGGKSTLLKAILGLVPYTGRITFCTETMCGAGRPNIGYVPQYLDFDRGIPLTVRDFLSLKYQKKPVWLGYERSVLEEAEEALAWAGAQHLMGKKMGGLSGGEQQRVMLAFALMDKPDIILLDEPVSGVDAAGEEIFAELLRKLQAERHFTVVLVSHDLSVVTQHADRVICLNKTVRCVGRTIEVLTTENLARLYGPHTGLHVHPEGMEPDPNA